MVNETIFHKKADLKKTGLKNGEKLNL